MSLAGQAVGKVREWVGKSAASTANAWFALIGSTRNKYIIPDTPEGYMRAFEQNEWVFAATTYRARNIGSIEFKLMKPEGDGMVEVLDHPILGMINDTTEVAEVTARRTYQLEQDSVVFGESFQFVETMNTGEPVELIRIEPQRVQVLRSKIGGALISGYKITLLSGGTAIRTPEQMIYHRPVPSLRDPTKGTSLIKSIRSVVQLSLGADALNLAFFSNGGRVDTVITIPEPLDSPERQEVLDGWNEAHAGPEASGAVSVLSGGADIKVLTTTPKEADFNASQKNFMLRIATALGVDPVLLGFEASNKASFEGKKIEFWEGLGIPQAKYYALVYTKQLLSMFKDTDGWVVVPDFSKVSALIDRQLTRAQGLVLATGGVGVMTPNAAGKLIDQPEQDGGDAIYAPLNVAPITEPITGPTEDS